MTNQNLKIGYAITTSTKSGYIGAILVSDEKGFPIEFQYTDPIAPTKLQKVLYGNSLEKYLKVDVLLDNLLKVLSNKIDLLIVQDEQLLGYNKTDIVRITETSIAEIQDNKDVDRVKENEFIIRYSKTASPTRITFGKEISEDDALFQKVYSITKCLGENINIAEPLERVQKSIEVIVSKDKE